jgi:hypothetical protein
MLKYIQKAWECFYGVGQQGAMVPEYIEWLHRCDSHEDAHDPTRYVKPDISGIALDDLFVDASTTEPMQHAVLRAFLRLLPKIAIYLFNCAGLLYSHRPRQNRLQINYVLLYGSTRPEGSFEYGRRLRR